MNNNHNNEKSIYSNNAENSLITINYKDFNVINKDLMYIDRNEYFKNKYIIGLLFTASWCPPCKDFELKLKEFYKEIRSKYDDQEQFCIIQISSEKNEREFKDSIEDVDWIILPFDSPFINDLVETLNLKKIPSFYLLNNKGNVVADNCRKDIEDNEASEVWNNWANIINYLN